MSGPTTTLPFDLKELMTVNVTWESFQGFDGHGQPSYAAPVTLKGWVEEAGMIHGGADAVRSAEMTAADMVYQLFFAGDSSEAQSFTLYDRFTLPETVAGPTLSLQPDLINTFFAPPFDNQAPWLVQVTMS